MPQKDSHINTSRAGIACADPVLLDSASVVVLGVGDGIVRKAVPQQQVS